MAQITKTSQALLKVQTALKAPKEKQNSYGGYAYRSCSDILEAVKPLLAENHLLLTLSDDVKLIGAHYYIVATAAVSLDDLSEPAIAVTGYAREPESRKGMDDAQVTGSTSSYARKYALNGLFLVDDSRDADALGTQPQPQQQTKQPSPSLEQALAEASTVGSRMALTNYWNKYPQYQGDPKFLAAVESLGKKFPNK